MNLILLNFLSFNDMQKSEMYLFVNKEKVGSFFKEI